MLYKNPAKIICSERARMNVNAKTLIKYMLVLVSKIRFIGTGSFTR
ncbi:MAG: hypothetical protein PF569_06295 [Candidatus Woesearchaeota archaeon]|nr:hypothetical protein [Candidatus Woesearchaeota archaeon]